MGNLLRLITGESKEDSQQIFLDFENARPTPEEQEVWEVVNTVLENSSKVLDELKNYRGASDEIRQAISNSRDDALQEVAWQQVLPLVAKLKHFYEFSMELETIVPQLLHALCVSGTSADQRLTNKQALAKQFAEVLHFTLKFDDLKLTNPNIQNDFSYYRRTLSRKRIANEDSGVSAADDQAQVTTEMANRMSLFYAYPTPMLKTLSDATSKFVSENKNLPIENTTDMLSTLCTLCRVMVENEEIAQKFENEETKLFVLSVMVGVVILYDHVHPVGAFTKVSAIDMRATIRVLKDQPQGTVDGLFNALRYTTKHLSDDTTPKQIKMLLA
ncbi:CYFIP-related Rac1 interactor B-like [Clytia hemisphaerica]|uniref:CYRIA/CYRIB Rac1 binding domain-containing protein n=1 Tax=Clytia hemisphaerica TaxID=252671 RepID=A0A7M5XE49_9CNID|eukprot:TCONS_00001760-protein